jgi:hypothetical protein
LRSGEVPPIEIAKFARNKKPDRPSRAPVAANASFCETVLAR